MSQIVLGLLAEIDGSFECFVVVPFTVYVKQLVRKIEIVEVQVDHLRNPQSRIKDQTGDASVAFLVLLVAVQRLLIVLNVRSVSFRDIADELQQLVFLQNFPL
ncbi:hypothetical protein D1872_268450 [compost metagenome]